MSERGDSVAGEMRTVAEIKATGAAWITEAELERLCDLAARCEELERERREQQEAWIREQREAAKIYSHDLAAAESLLEEARGALGEILLALSTQYERELAESLLAKLEAR